MRPPVTSFQGSRKYALNPTAATNYQRECAPNFRKSLSDPVLCLVKPELGGGQSSAREYLSIAGQPDRFDGRRHAWHAGLARMQTLRGLPGL